jgi:hypothetical protein
MRRTLILQSAFVVSLSAFAARPNVIIIQTDEHNFRTLGSYRKLLPPDQAFIRGEGGARIPFVVAVPGMIQSGTVINEALGTVDYKPTLLSLPGVEAKLARASGY